MTENSGGQSNSTTRASEPLKRGSLRTIAGVLLIVAVGGGIWLAVRRGTVALLLAKLRALPLGPNWDLWVAASFALLGLLGVFILWKVPQWQVSRIEGLDSKERFEKRNEARNTLATILGGVAFLTGGYFAWQNFNLAKEGQITDR
jgi:hypothetical protein